MRGANKLDLFTFVTALVLLLLSAILCLSLLIHPAYAQGYEEISLVQHMSKLMEIKGITRVAVTEPDIADVVVVSDTEILINAKEQGATTLHLWDDHTRKTYLIRVHDDVERAEGEIRNAIGIETVSVRLVRGALIVDGSVRDQNSLKRVLNIASAYSDEVIDLLEIRDPIQILLTVNIVEVYTSVTDRLGMEWGGIMRGVLVPKVVQFGETSIGSSMERLNMLGTELKFMVEEGVAKVLAEPELMIMSGESAEFLVGGEIPVYIGAGADGTIEWKPYGVQLSIKADVDPLGNIRLDISPEVSSLDWSNSISTQTGTLPGIRTRKMNTVVSVTDRIPVILGGLIQNEVSKTIRKVPVLGEIPIIGELFKSEEFQENETELVIIVTPTIIKG